MQRADPFGGLAGRADPSGRIAAGASQDGGRTSAADIAMDQLLALRRIEGLLLALPGAIAAAVATTPARLADADRRLLATVLAAVAGDVGPRGRVFSSREAVDYLSAADPEALSTITTGSDTVKVLGKLLSRGDGQVIDGLLLMRDGHHRGSVNWRVTRV